MRLIDINCPNCGCKIHVEPEPEPQWIPCSERLPQKDEQVLCCNKRGSVYTSAYTYTDNRGVAVFGQHIDVIAWMPLPEPYAERRTDEQADIR